MRRLLVRRSEARLYVATGPASPANWSFMKEHAVAASPMTSSAQHGTVLWQLLLLVIHKHQPLETKVAYVRDHGRPVANASLLSRQPAHVRWR